MNESCVSRMLYIFVINFSVMQMLWNSFKNLTHIFVTHGHGDHLGDTVALAKSNERRDNASSRRAPDLKVFQRVFSLRFDYYTSSVDALYATPEAAL